MTQVVKHRLDIWISKFCNMFFYKSKIKLILLLCGWSFITFSVSTRAEENPNAEYVLKTIFLYNLAKFVSWPSDSFEDAQSPIVFGVLDKNPFGSALDAIRIKTIQNRKIMIRYFSAYEDVDGRHLLFISRSEKDQVAEIMKGLQHKKMLTIGDMKDFATQGGIINFILEDEKVRFEINLEAAKRSGIEISSQVLNLARIVNQ